MRLIAEITDRSVARRMLEHVGMSSELAQPWPARRPPALFGSIGSDEDQRCPHDEDLGIAWVNAE